MGVIESTIAITDSVSAPIRTICNALNMTISTFEQANIASDKTFDTNNYNAVRAKLGQVNTELDKIEKNILDANNAQNKFKTTSEQLPGLIGSIATQIKSYATMLIGIQGIKMGINFYKDSIEGANVQIAAEQKLQVVMNQRMGAIKQEIDNVKQLTAAQQELGVVGDEVQMAGAQQLATFLNTSGVLSTLIPAMNNLAVQQNGVNVTSENMVSIGNMMGKVMQGQTSALTRVGITFSEAQEKALKYGNEQERAATLAQVITDNVGKMNEAMRETPEGQIASINNTWGDMKEVVGMQIYPVILNLFNTINSFLPSVAPVLTGITTVVGGIVTALVVVLSIVGKIGTFVVDNWSIIGPIVYGIAAALAVYYGWMLLVGTATKIWSGIQAAFNAIMAMNPVMLVVLAIIALIAVIFAVCGAIAKFTGVANSGFGVMCGGVNVVIKFFKNLGLWVANVALGIGNAFVAVTDNIKAAFHNAISSVKGFFYDLMSTALTIIGNIAEKLNSLPFIEFDFSGITSAADEYAAKAATEKNNKKEYENISDAFNKGMSTFDTFQDGWAADAFKSGAAWGDEKWAAVKDKFSFDSFAPDDLMKGLGIGGIGGTDGDTGMGSTTNSLGSIDKNTKETAEELKQSNKFLEALKDTASKYVVKQYTTNTYHIDMTGQQFNVKGAVDVADIAPTLMRDLQAAMASSVAGADNVIVGGKL